MSVLLLILKIIGIVLLAVLGILLFLILLILFVPIRYKITGKAEEQVTIQGQFTWLLHLLSFRFSYDDGEIEQCLKIFGIRKKGKSKADDEDFEDDETEYAETEADSVEADDMESDVVDDRLPEIDDGVAEEEKQVPGEESKKLENTSTSGNAKSGAGIIDRIRNFFEKIKTTLIQIKETLFHMKDKVSDIKNILTDETNKKAGKILWAQVLYLLKHFRFRKIHTELAFSLGDPALTGQTLGVLSMMPFLYQYQFHVYPDFESDRTYVRGTFDIKGRVRVLHLLVALIRIIKVKECRMLIKKIMK